jgi:hypothetical protein
VVSIIVICIVIAVILVVLVMSINLVWLQHRCSMYREQISDMYAELIYRCSHNKNEAHKLLTEWRVNIKTDARDIWTEEELLQRVDFAKKELQHEIEVHDKFVSCCEKLSGITHTDKLPEYIIEYHKYLVNSIDYRKCISITPLTTDVANKAESLNYDNSQYNKVITECEKKLNMIHTS